MRSFALIAVCLLAIALASGCTQESQDQTPADNQQPDMQQTVNLEEQSYQLLDQELDNAVENITLEDLENTLLEQ